MRFRTFGVRKSFIFRALSLKISFFIYQTQHFTLKTCLCAEYLTLAVSSDVWEFASVGLAGCSFLFFVLLPALCNGASKANMFPAHLRRGMDKCSSAPLNVLDQAINQPPANEHDDLDETFKAFPQT